jgi:hypothetical protein
MNIATSRNTAELRRSQTQATKPLLFSAVAAGDVRAE